MPLTELPLNDVRFVLSRLPKDVLTLIREQRLILGGGFIRATIAGEKVNDIDLFGDDKERIKAIAYEFSAKHGGRVHETVNALTILHPHRLPIQFITRWTYNAPFDVVNSFDFTIAQVVIWMKNQFQGICSDRFYQDLAARRLVYTFPQREEEAGGSLLRAKKFLSRGYIMTAPNFAGVIARIVKKIDYQKVDQADEKVIAGVISGLLLEVDPATVIDGMDVIDEHEVKE